MSFGEEETDALIADSGSGGLKSGFAGDVVCETVVPSILGQPKLSPRQALSTNANANMEESKRNPDSSSNNGNNANNMESRRNPDRYLRVDGEVFHVDDLTYPTEHLSRQDVEKVWLHTLKFVVQIYIYLFIGSICFLYFLYYYS